jgi:hypothetical protein
MTFVSYLSLVSVDIYLENEIDKRKKKKEYKLDLARPV